MGRSGCPSPYPNSPFPASSLVSPAHAPLARAKYGFIYERWAHLLVVPFPAQPCPSWRETESNWHPQGFRYGLIDCPGDTWIHVPKEGLRIGRAGRLNTMTPAGEILVWQCHEHRHGSSQSPGCRIAETQACFFFALWDQPAPR